MSLFGHRRRHGHAAHVMIAIDGRKPKILQPTTTVADGDKVHHTGGNPMDTGGRTLSSTGTTTTTGKRLKNNKRFVGPECANTLHRCGAAGPGHGIVRVITRATISGTACLSTSPTPIATRPRLTAFIFARNTRGTRQCTRMHSRILCPETGAADATM